MNVRNVALKVLIEIIENGAYANLALKDAAHEVPKSEVPFLYALVYTTLEHRSYTEYLLAHCCKRQKKTVRTILLLGASELLYLNTPAHAVIHSAVQLAKESGKAASAGLVNAVLRRIDRERNALAPLPQDPVERLSVLYGYPVFILRDWIDSFGIEAAEQIASAKASDLQIRAQYPFTTSALQAALPMATVTGKLDPNCLHVESGFDLTENELFRDGKMTVQNEGAMMICRALGDLHGKTVLDACAAPGGKTAYLASLAENSACFTAWELHPHRIELMQKTFSRLHVDAKIECRDASVLYADCVERFDAVLLDVPCSGFGLLSDKPDLKYRKTEQDVESLAELQERILNACSRYVKPGGTLVYATCTISSLENGRQMERFLSAHTEYQVAEQRQFLPQTDGIDGFYYAKLIRGNTL